MKKTTQYSIYLSILTCKLAKNFASIQVNVIPVIAKADIIGKSELVKFKKKIMDELKDVQIYEFPTDDENVADTNALMNKIVPFAVVGSTDEIKIGNKMVKVNISLSSTFTI